jgi:hypothetical protein
MNHESIVSLICCGGIVGSIMEWFPEVAAIPGAIWFTILIVKEVRSWLR